jgi:hypothetical protein
MIDQKVMKQIQEASVAERIQLIEQILQSLKEDLPSSPAGAKPKAKPFRVRQFDLGRNVPTDRNLIYAEREL